MRRSQIREYLRYQQYTDTTTRDDPAGAEHTSCDAGGCKPGRLPGKKAEGKGSDGRTTPIGRHLCGIGLQRVVQHVEAQA